jgi:hypothetical protein
VANAAAALGFGAPASRKPSSTRDLSGDEHPFHIEESDRGSYFKFHTQRGLRAYSLRRGPEQLCRLHCDRSAVKDNEISLAKVEVVREP